MRLFFLLFITVPILEMWLLIEVGTHIGALSTIFLVFLTAAIGLALLRQQGLSTLLRVNEKIEQGQLPASEIIEGVMLAVGGALLLTPGFITDFVGFCCLLPASRKPLASLMLKRGVFMATAGQSQRFRARANDAKVDGFSDMDGTHQSDPSRSAKNDPLNSGGETLDGEYRRED